jgi:hypothetical protein
MRLNGSGFSGMRAGFRDGTGGVRRQGERTSPFLGAVLITAGFIVEGVNYALEIAEIGAEGE